MTPLELLSDLEDRGVRLQAAGDWITFEAPRGVLQDAEREALRAHKAAVLALLRGRQARGVAGVDRAKFALWQLDRVLEIAVPWADVPLILAPGCRIARELRERETRSAGRVWCVCEALDLLLTNVPPDDARKIAEAKLLFGGTMAGVSLGAARGR